MHGMRLGLVVLCALSAVVPAAGAGDPKAVIRAIEKARDEHRAAAMASAGRTDARATFQKVRALVTEAIRDVDPAQLPADQCLDWAMVFREAEKPDVALQLLERAAPVVPEERRHEIDSVRMEALMDKGDGENLEAVLRDVYPESQFQAQSVVTRICSTGADVMLDSIGADRTLAALDRLADHITPRVLSIATPSRSGRLSNLMDALDPNSTRRAVREVNVQDAATSIAIDFALAKARVLERAHREPEAVKALDAVQDKPGVAQSGKRERLAEARKRLGLFGKEAPAVAAAYTIGDYPGLDALRGKVVVLDFFGWWCGPCKQSFGDLGSLYRDLKDRGVEMVSVTMLQGCFEDENRELGDMPPATEVERMKGFAAQHGITWPIAFVDESVLQEYLVPGVPYAVVIGRDGKVIRTELGYSVETYKAFREFVEKQL